VNRWTNSVLLEREQIRSRSHRKVPELELLRERKRGYSAQEGKQGWRYLKAWKVSKVHSKLSKHRLGVEEE
jgi:hypothetical protein